MKKITSITIILTLLAACDCNQQVEGTVIDSATKKPIGNVEIYNQIKPRNKTQTDENGFFKLSNISGGLTRPPMKIIIEHKDYERVETEIEAGGRKDILLIKKKTNESNDTLTYQQAIAHIKSIFEDYKTNEEGIESEENKTVMTKSLNSLQNVTNKKDLQLLINVWNYYDPTDYSCRDKIYKILLQNKETSINALKDRMKNKMSWENADLSGTEFKNLLTQLENEK